MITIRDNITDKDVLDIAEILSSTCFFTEKEIIVAQEMAEETIVKGTSESTYHWLFAEINNQTIAIACYGLNPVSMYSIDLYWIAVHNSCRNKGIGKKLLKKIEHHCKQINSKTIWVETSSQYKYNSTRQFYIKCGYREKAYLKDFYDTDDSKIIYSKKL